MNLGWTPPITSDHGLDEVVRILDQTNIIVHDFNGIINRWSTGASILYGWSRDEAIGKVVFELLATRYDQPANEIRAQLQTSGSWKGELSHRHKNGYYIPISSQMSCMVIGEPENPLILQFNTEISQIKDMQVDLASREAHLRSILETVPESMIVIDEAGLITSFSAASETLFGYTAAEVRGRNVRMLMPSPNREAHDSYISNYLQTGVRRIIGYGRVVNGLRKDGTTFPMELAIGEAIAEGRRIFTGFIRDLTSRQKIEEELRQAQKMEAVGQLTGGVAHDFNNLLTVISGNLEMLEARIVDPKLLELLREAQDATDDGAKLTGQLLAFGRRQPLNPKLTDVGLLVRGFFDLVRRSIGESVELRIIVNAGENQALVDGSQLQNALLNLALNARDAMPRGGLLTIEVSKVYLDIDYAQMYPEVRTGDYIVIAVTDTGVGMTEEVKLHAFEPFFTTKEVGSGSGLGLSMVYGFVKQTGGHVQIYSEPEHGTSVRIFLPVLQEVANDNDGAGNSPARAAAVLRGHEKILVVEDDARVRRVTVARLHDAGYEVIEASNGPQALELLDVHTEISLLFTDIVMPGGMHGNELADLARTIKPQIKVLFTSGYAEPSVAGKEFAETENWLKKPYTAAELAARLRKLLD
ncbi:MAG: sensor histidine kinase [Rhizobium sp.]|nr:sensor histidine kinase [Rhizobium sp.]